VVLAMTVAVVLGTVLTQKQNAPTFTPSPQEILKELESLLISVSFDNGKALQNQSTPQNNALNWLANNNTNLDTYSNVTKIQRYALATLFYSTNGISWGGKDEWMSNTNECLWYNSGFSVCTNGSVDTLSLESNNLIGTIPNELALLSNLCESSIVWLLVGMIVLSCVFYIVLSCLLVIFHSTAYLYLYVNSLTGTIPNNLTGTIPSQIGLLTKLSKSSVVWLLVVMIVLSCVFHCTLMLACHFSFYR
jgi:hypothetical protein